MESVFNDVRDAVVKGISMVRLRHKCRAEANREEKNADFWTLSAKGTRCHRKVKCCLSTMTGNPVRSAKINMIDKSAKSQ